VLEQAPERLRDDLRLQGSLPKGEQRLRPIERLRHSRLLDQAPLAEDLQEAPDLAGQPLRRPRPARADDADFLLEARVLHVEVEAAPAQRVPQLARAV